MSDRDVFNGDAVAGGSEGHQSYGAVCLNCGRARREVAELGGWCGPCSGVETPWGPELVLAASEKLRAWAAKSPRIQRQHAEVERLWAEHQKNRKPVKQRFGSDVDEGR